MKYTHFPRNLEQIYYMIATFYQQKADKNTSAKHFQSLKTVFLKSTRNKWPSTVSYPWKVHLSNWKTMSGKGGAMDRKGHYLQDGGISELNLFPKKEREF